MNICMALKYLHDQQILHKNLLPEVQYRFNSDNLYISSMWIKGVLGPIIQLKCSEHVSYLALDLFILMCDL